MVPTPHAATKGDYEVLQVEKNGPKVAVNKTSSPLHTLWRHGHISQGLAEAGEVFEAVYRLVWGGFKRDVLDQVIRGESVETANLVDRIIRCKTMLRVIEAHLTRAQYLILLSVCVDQLYIGANTAANRESYENIKIALARCSQVFGVPEYQGDTGKPS